MSANIKGLHVADHSVNINAKPQTKRINDIHQSSTTKSLDILMSANSPLAGELGRIDETDDATIRDTAAGR
jgi:hypothetical protein